MTTPTMTPKRFEAVTAVMEAYLAGKADLNHDFIAEVWAEVQRARRVLEESQEQVSILIDYQRAAEAEVAALRTNITALTDENQTYMAGIAEVVSGIKGLHRVVKPWSGG
jgi:phage shock protein A